MKGGIALVWLNGDLRLADNPALSAALAAHDTAIPVYIWSPEEEKPWAPGGASRWWLHQSLKKLGETLEKRGARLILRRGPAAMALAELARETGATAVFWNNRYEPHLAARDEQVREALEKRGLACTSCSGNLLFQPGMVLNGSGKPFQVFTAFWRACLAMPEPPEPLPSPKKLRAPEKFPSSLPLAALRLEPEIDWAAGLRESWTPGEAGAAKALLGFADEALGDYAAARDRPAAPGTSRLSPHLHFGEASARQVWHYLKRHVKEQSAAAVYLRQLGWRDFSHHLLVHFPHTDAAPLRAEFARFPWRRDAKNLKRWQRGQTGYPLVDAGMRELWHTGWMHNRVRMVVASFLVKHLLISWRDGAAWFWDTLVDADLANNTMGWQWSAGSGADAAPYFRIFNPVLQGEKFDAAGIYVSRWVPELAKLPAKWIHRPWEAPAAELARAGVTLGKTYPAPIVPHETARRRALAALASLKGPAAGDLFAAEGE
jgi:deoxyribodipyrimidine photo-lyase